MEGGFEQKVTEETKRKRAGMEEGFALNFCSLLYRGSALRRHEVAPLMAAVAERFVFRLTAAAEGDGGLFGGDLELISGGVDDGEGTLNEERTVVADGDGGHGCS
jgi:hypothetical protein